MRVRALGRFWLKANGVCVCVCAVQVHAHTCAVCVCERGQRHADAIAMMRRGTNGRVCTQVCQCVTHRRITSYVKRNVMTHERYLVCQKMFYLGT